MKADELHSKTLTFIFQKQKMKQNCSSWMAETAFRLVYGVLVSMETNASSRERAKTFTKPLKRSRFAASERLTADKPGAFVRAPALILDL